ncbi:MAG: Rrf2 family transcriptional regulator [Acetobacteraceae bacterium]|jgi:Rrf2 family protein|nr:Rrf2 family transcriptional regulator [Acetobacteraceae bacterium]
MLSSKAKYALRALVCLAEAHRSDRWMLASEIAVAEAIPKKFLEAILVELRDEGIVKSRRGRYGGYRLARAPSLTSAGAVIRSIDGSLSLTPCASRTHFEQCADCVDVNLCPMQPLLRQARDAVAAVLDSCSIADLASPQPKKSSRTPRVAV